MSDLDVNVLIEAKRQLRDTGWGQGAIVCENGTLCAIGAIHVALGAKPVLHTDEDGDNFYDLLYPYGERPDYFKTERSEWYAWEAKRDAWQAKALEYEALLNEAVTSIPRPFPQGDPDEQNFTWVADYNDSAGTTVEDVEAVFDEAIALVQAKETVSV
jgi:hypothetical protein